jgi:RNA polymerase sigma-70 factor (ECF subfamily)
LNTVNRPNVESPDLRLVERAAVGDREARRELFERFREPAYRVALRITGRAEDALDVVQDSFIRAFERLADFQRDAGFQTWLLRIVSNRSLDLLRARKVRLAVPLDSGDDEPRYEPATTDRQSLPGTELERGELADRLRHVTETLPPDQRAVFALYATGDMTYGQIAEAMGIPIGTVMSRLFHARRRLQAMLPDLAPRSGGAENS